MKNLFSSIIEKVKKHIVNLTPATRIRYVVISIFTVVVAASLLVAVSLNTSEPEAPTNPEDFGIGETASIDFDNEIIFDIGDENSSVTTTDVITEDSSVTTDEVSETEKNTSGEESTNVQTENNTELIDEPELQPTDPSQDYNPDPQPEDTTNTPVVNLEPTETTTQTQTAPKPTETTTKAPQTEPKPTETTKTPQTQPKPTETTTTVPQTTTKPTETTKPQETEPQPVGQFSLKEKKYDYNGANVTILQVENKSQQAYTITITGKFKDANGNIVKTESKTFEGFPAEWSNYFVFQPGIKYNSVSWDMKADVFNGETFAQYIYPGNSVYAEIGFGNTDGSGEFVYPDAQHPPHTLKQVVTIFISASPTYNTYHTALAYSNDMVLFGTDNKILFIGTPGKRTNFFATKDAPETRQMPMFVTDTLWKDKDKYQLPTYLANATGIMAITSVSKY